MMEKRTTMQILDNINALWWDGLKTTIKPGVKLKIAVAYMPLHGFKDDTVKINVEQIFKLMSPGTEVKTI